MTIRTPKFLFTSGLANPLELGQEDRRFHIEPVKPAPLDPKEVTVNTYNTSQSSWSPNANGVEVTHKPTGLKARCGSERSAWRNRDKAFELLATEVEKMKGLITPKEKEEGELLKRINEFMERYPTQPLFEIPKEGWGTGWHVGIDESKVPADGRVEIDFGFPSVALVDNQFAFVDTVAGTIICEDLNHPDSRVAVELARRGWTPPGMGLIQYPEIIRQRTATEYGIGWNECRLATMRLNQKNAPVKDHRSAYTGPEMAFPPGGNNEQGS